jgi:large subunit ribosomal protein L1
MKHGKRYVDLLQKYDKHATYSMQEAVDLVKDLSSAKFDETVELSINLNLRKGSSVRDTLVLPHQFRGEKRILVFARGDKAQEARDAGATYVGDDDLIQAIRDGWLDFDVTVATPDMMKDVGRLGPILGRRGMMPNPKTQTVTNDLTTAINELKKGRVEFRSDKTGVVHMAVGKVSMDTESILETARIIIDEVSKKRPADQKGDFVKTVSFSSTMGPGVWADATAVSA